MRHACATFAVFLALALVATPAVAQKKSTHPSEVACVDLTAETLPDGSPTDRGRSIIHWVTGFLDGLEWSRGRRNLPDKFESAAVVKGVQEFCRSNGAMNIVPAVLQALKLPTR